MDKNSEQNTTTQKTHGASNNDDKFRKFVEMSPSSILVVRDDKYVYANPAGAARLGFNNPTDIVGIYVLDAIHPDYHPVIKQRLENSYSGITNPPIEVKMLKPSGEEIFIETTSLPFEFEGEPAIMVIGYDVTDRKNAEESLIAARIKEEKRSKLISKLIEIIHNFEYSLNFDEILENVSRLTSKFLNCQCAICDMDSSKHHSAQSINYHSNDFYSNIKKTEQKRILAYIKTLDFNKPTIINYSDKEESEEKINAELADLGSILICPISVENNLYGAIICFRSLKEPEFNQEDLSFITELASHMSASLTIAKLYSRQARIAETLQRSLIPENFCVNSLDIATGYYPAPGDCQIGGDFFDIFNISENKICVTIGDVSGKGIAAATHTAEVKYMIRGFALQNDEPSYVISQVNNALNKYTNEDGFVSLIYMAIDTKFYKIKFSNAGHEIPILKKAADNSILELKPTGPVMGIDFDMHYDSDSVDFEPNDILICYTDGILDIRIDNCWFNYESFKERAVELCENNASGTMKNLINYIRQLSNNKQTDDQALVVIRNIAK